MKKTIVTLPVLLVFVLVSCVWVYAQPASTWKPSDKIRWICPHGPGGGFDRWSRAQAKSMQKYVGVPVVVDNVTGTGGVNAMQTLWRSKPDGQTVHLTSALLGDRIQINALEIVDNAILVDMVAHGPDDPMCCPTQRVQQSYVLEGDQLRDTSGQ